MKKSLDNEVTLWYYNTILTDLVDKRVFMYISEKYQYVLRSTFELVKNTDSDSNEDRGEC